MRTLTIILVLLVGTLVGARWLDRALGLADGTLTYFLVGPLLFVGLGAAYIAFRQLRHRGEEVWANPNPDGGSLSELSGHGTHVPLHVDSPDIPDISGGSD
jgi:hypothetical protein